MIYMKKRYLMLILLAFLVTLAACGKNETTYDPNNFNPTGDKIVNEKITLTFFAPLHSLHDADGYNAMKLFEKMEEITNIHIEWVYGPVATYDEKKSLSLNNYKNIDAYFMWNTLDEQVKLSSLGVLRPLEDLFADYAPNYDQLLKENDEYRKISTLDDGHIYSTVVINDVPRDQTFKQFINQTWLDNLGLSMPTTTAEYYNVLKAFKTQDPNQNGIPDEIPLSSAELYQTRNFLMSAFGFVSTGIEVKDDIVHYVPSTSNYRAYLHYAHQLYEEGLLDNSTFTMSTSQLAAKGNLVGSFDGAAAYLVVGESYDEDYVAIPALTSDINDEQMWLGFNTTTPTGLMIPSTTPYYREILRWIDFLYSEKGIELQAFGEEGVDFRWNNDEKTSFHFNVPEGVNAEVFRGTITPGVGIGAVAYWDQRFVLKDDNALTSRINKVVEDAGYFDVLKIPFPQVIFTNEETKKIAIIATDLDIYMKIFEERVITGKIELNNQTWQEHLDNLDKLGFDAYLDVYQAAYQRYQAK
jgi:putative aldouronate transport system substrate-binding protein